MSVQAIIKEAMNKNPLGFEEALKEELSARIAVALEAKMQEADLDEAHGVFRKGGSIGEKKSKDPIKVHDNAEDAKAHAKRLNAQLSQGEKKYYGIKYHVKPIQEGFAVLEYHEEAEHIDENERVMKDGYYVANHKQEITHDKPFNDSKSAISHANKGENKTGYVHRVTKVKGGKVDKQWEYNGGHMDGGWEHFSDFKGDPAHQHFRNIPKHFIHGTD